MPLCNKRGAGVSFHRINGDPLDADDEFTSRYDEADPDAWKPFVISNPPVAGDGVAYIEQRADATIRQFVGGAKGMENTIGEDAIAGKTAAKNTKRRPEESPAPAASVSRAAKKAKHAGCARRETTRLLALRL